MLKRANFRPFARFLLALTFILSALGITPVQAQDAPEALAPSTWQTTATGMLSTQNGAAHVGGLGYVVKVQNWPQLILRGGVQNAPDSYVGIRLTGPIGITLGQVGVTGSSGGLTTQAVDWARNQLTFSSGGSQVLFHVNRLSPAVALQTSAASLSLFTGSLPRYTIDSSQVVRLSDGSVAPKYVAYPTSGGVQVKALSGSTTALTGMSANWALVWYGANTHIVDSRMPLSYEWTLPTSDAFRADSPQLLVFQNNPTGIKQGGSGGVDLTFSSSAGAMAILPLDGRLMRRMTETEAWAGGLPAAVSNKAAWWAGRLGEFPLTVSETYAYNSSTDTTSVTESFTFLTIKSGGTRLAPLPPMLSLARDSLPIAFSGTVVDGGLSGEFGPSQGIEGVQSYTWSMSGLREYTDSRRVLQNGGVPEELTSRLNAEVQKVVASGHYTPWIFLDAVPVHRSRGDLYWDNPADGILHLVEVAEALEDPGLKSALINYITTERNAYPPETVYALSVTQGEMRGPFSYYDDGVRYAWNPNATQGDTKQYVFLKDVPLYSFYALSRYYDLTGSALPALTWQKANETLNRDMSEQDWATSYWFANYEDRRIATENANRHLAGMIGYIRLAQLQGDTASENLARSLLLKAVVTRVGMARYPRYLGITGLIQVPASNPDWLMEYRSHPFIGYLYNYQWTSAYDDPRQVAYMNQFAVDVNDYNYLQSPYNHLRRDFDTRPSGQDSPYLAVFRDMVPEAGRILRDYALEDVDIAVQKITALYPHWYAAFAEGTLGWEHNLAHPIDSFQVFNAYAWIEDASPQDLGRYADIGWLSEGDYFYMQKLSEAVKSFRGYSWRGASYVRLTVIPGDGSLTLMWQAVLEETDGVTWTIELDGPGGTQTVTDLPFATTHYQFTGLTNYAHYTVTLTAYDSNGEPVLSSDPKFGMPSDLLFFLPALMKGSH